MASSTRAAAIAYAGRGFHVVGLYSVTGSGCACRRGAACVSQGKHPRRDLAPNGARSIAPTPHQILQWEPPYNIGIVLGKAMATGRGVRFAHTFDVDDPAVANLLRAQGIEQQTAVATTGRGLHVWMGTPSPAAPFNPKTVTGQTLGEFRGDGQYVVVPPSRHRSGAAYAWLNAAGRIMPTIHVVDDPVRYIRELLASVGVRMAEPTYADAFALDDDDEGELKQIERVPPELSRYLYQESVLLAQRLNLRCDRDRSGSLWHHAMNIRDGAAKAEYQMTQELVAGLLKRLDRVSYACYTHRPSAEGDREYRRIAAKVLKSRSAN